MRIFLSYSRVDEQDVAVIREDLQDVGHEVWLDKKLTGGQLWWNAILDQIRRSDLLILVISESSIKSEACLAEMQYAHALGRPILPICLTDHVNEGLTPDPLPSLQWISYSTGDDKSDLKSLLRAVATVRPRELPEPLPDEPELPMSYVVELQNAAASEKNYSREQQVILLDKIETRIDDSDNRAELLSVLTTLRRRPDLFANLVPKIDRLVARLADTSGQSASVESGIDLSGVWIESPEFDALLAASERGIREEDVVITLSQDGSQLQGFLVNTYRSGRWRPQSVTVHETLVGRISGREVELDGVDYVITGGRTHDPYFLDRYQLVLEDDGSLRGTAADDAGDYGQVTLLRVAVEGPTTGDGQF